MVILKKKKEETMDFKEIKEIVEEKNEKNVLPQTEKPKEIQQIEKKNIPLFVKLDKYKAILDILNDMKSILFFAKNTLSVQKQIEILLEENKKLLEDAISKLDQKLLSLEKELTKPGLHEAKIEEPKESKDLDNILEELKKQIESLKGDLKNIS